ncbi:MAG: hypothetical protein PHE88_09940 [Elusimicrobia bacterium]|nr:hypothetical protein [Elusimicrobiota bacterium]
MYFKKFNKSIIILIAILFISITKIYAEIDIFEKYTFLGQPANDIEHYNYSEDKIYAPSAGAYQIGNGKMFATVGMFSPICTLSFICGPVYDEPYLGQEILYVSIGGKTLQWEKQQIYRIKDADIVVSRLSNQTVELTVVDFVPPELPVIFRIIQITNKSSNKLTNIGLQFHISKLNKKKSWKFTKNSEPEVRIRIPNRKNIRWYGLQTIGLKPNVGKGKVSYTIASIPTEQTWQGSHIIIAADQEKQLQPVSKQISDNNTDFLQQTYDHWKKWIDDTAVLEINDPVIKRIFDAQTIFLKTQQSNVGGSSPMAGYSNIWVRDMNGPVRFFLRIGKFQEAKENLDWFYQFTGRTSFLPTSTRAAYSLPKWPSQIDWSTLSIDSAEYPSWIVLQHYWYYQYTGDLEYLRPRFYYLKQCLLGQPISKEYLLPFNTDEGYFWALQSRLFDQIPVHNFLGLHSYSPDSAFTYVAAEEALSEIGKQLGYKKDSLQLLQQAKEIRAKSEQTYWLEDLKYYAPALSPSGKLYNFPHSTILLNSIWSGYLLPDEPHAKHSIEAVLKFLSNKKMYLNTSPELPYFTGITMGLLLSDLARMSDNQAESALQAIKDASSPAGEFGEFHDMNGKPWSLPSWGIGTYGRAKPWDGGIIADAILEYLTGIQPDAINKTLTLSPQLPKGVNSMRFGPFKMGNNQYILSVKEDHIGERIYEIQQIAGETTNINLKLCLPTTQYIFISNDGKNAIQVKPTEVLSNKLETQKTWIVKSEYQPCEPAISQPTSFTNPPHISIFSGSDIVWVAAGDAESYNWLVQFGTTTFIDIEMPLSPEELVNSFYDVEKKLSKTRLLIFGPGAFSIGPTTWKGQDFWNSSVLRNSLTAFLKEGGIIIVMSPPSARMGTEVNLPWLKSFINGKWSHTGKSGHAIAVNPKKVYSSKELKPVSINKEKSGIIITWNLNSKENYIIKTTGLLKVKYQSGWQDVIKKKQEQTYTVSPEWIHENKLIVMVTDLNTILMQRKTKIVPSLAQRLGFPQDVIIGSASTGLRPSGSFKSPVLIKNRPKDAALIFTSTEKGLFIKTTLNLKDLKPLIISLINGNYLKNQ